MSREDLAKVIKSTPDVRRVPQEMVCRGHQCGEVTTGLYLTPEEVQNTAFLVDWLTKAMGLESPVPILPDPRTPEERQRLFPRLTPMPTP